MSEKDCDETTVGVTCHFLHLPQSFFNMINHNRLQLKCDFMYAGTWYNRGLKLYTVCAISVGFNWRKTDFGKKN
jgi:hypothetical protein